MKAASMAPVATSAPVSIGPVAVNNPDTRSSPRAAATETPSPSASARGGNGAVMPAFSAPATPERRDGPTLTLESNPSTSAHASRTGERALEAAKPNPSGSDTKSSDAKDGGSATAGKLRMTVDGEHLYAEIKGGKIQLNDRTYDSLAHARDSVRRERNKVAVWEYFDEGVKAWRVLNRD